MLSLNRNGKVNYEVCDRQTTRINLPRQKNRRSAGSPARSSCTNFSTKSRAELNYHLAKKHSKATARVVHESKI